MKKNATRIKRKGEIKLLPFDTSYLNERYLIQASESRSFQISPLLYHILQRADGRSSSEEIAEEVSLLMEKDVSAADVESIAETHLIPNGLLSESDDDAQLREHGPKGGDKETVGRSGASSSAHDKSPLFFRIPLFSSNLLAPITAAASHFFSFVAATPALIAVLAVHYLFYSAFFAADHLDIIKISGVDYLLTYLLAIATVIFHEIGHSSACRRYGCSHGDIGFGLYLIFPVFYADVTDAWRLSRRQRAVIDVAGNYFQLMTVIPLYFLYRATGSSVFSIAILSVDVMIIFSLNPLFKWDGYWLFSDMIGVPNLRARAKETLKSAFLSLFRRCRTVGELSLLPRRHGILLLIYAVCSNLFFVFFGYKLCHFAPTLLSAYPEIAKQVWSGAAEALASGNPFPVLDGLLQLFFTTMPLVGIAFVVFHLTRPLRFLLLRLVQKTVKATQAGFSLGYSWLRPADLARSAKNPRSAGFSLPDDTPCPCAMSDHIRSIARGIR